MTIYRRIGNTEDFQAWLDSLPRDGTFHEMRTNEMVKLGVSLGFIDTQNKGRIRVVSSGKQVFTDDPHLTPIALFDAFPDIFVAFCNTGVWVRKPRKAK